MVLYLTRFLGQTKYQGMEHATALLNVGTNLDRQRVHVQQGKIYSYKMYDI